MAVIEITFEKVAHPGHPRTPDFSHPIGAPRRGWINYEWETFATTDGLWAVDWRRWECAIIDMNIVWRDFGPYS